MVETVLLVVLVCIALALVGLVLLQQGKGADAGASFGGGASQTVFGSAGSGNFMTKSTWFLATGFFIICLGLAYIARQQAEGGSGIDFSSPEPKAVIEQVNDTDVPSFDGAESPSSDSDVPAIPGVEEAVEEGSAIIDDGAATIETAVDRATSEAGELADEAQQKAEDVVDAAKEAAAN